ncbi:MAG: flagellar motor protein [Planctomycetes bacterium]|nr:flagellar motor protein [Planctomycetota bacterium]MCC7398856.1 flagellar motor protein [Planctomycetota bacterium]
MDIFSLLGLITALGGVLGGMVLEGGHPSSLLQDTAFLIVIVGSLGATMVATLPSDLPFAIKSLKRWLLPGKYDFHGVMEKILELANLARREGLLALETYANSGQGDPFLVKCLTLAIDGSSAEAIRETVEVDMHIAEEDDKAGMKFWESWGALAPTVGVLGAVLGLMHVMSVLSQPELIGPGIAVAFVATVYGVGYANIVCLPMSFKLKRHIEHDQLMKSMILEGVVGIQSGIAPGALRSKLKVYLGSHGGGGDKKH